MNIRRTKSLFKKEDVVALRADYDNSPGTKELLMELGNQALAIPYYAIYSPGLEQPIVFGGNVISAQRVELEIHRALEANKIAQQVSDNRVATIPLPAAGGSN